MVFSSCCEHLEKDGKFDTKSNLFDKGDSVFQLRGVFAFFVLITMTILSDLTSALTCTISNIKAHIRPYNTTLGVKLAM